MLKIYIQTTEALQSLRDDQAGVVSFEYIIVAVCIIAAVTAVFTATGNGTIQGALNTGIGRIATALNP